MTISKAIAGNMGNRNHRFTFYVQIDAMKGESFTGPDGASVSFDDTGLACFTLGDQESVIIQNIPGGVPVEVWEETEYPYTATWVLTGESSSEGTGKQSSFAMPNVSAALGFTNTLNAPIPTGVVMDMKVPSVLMILGLTGMTIWILSDRRRRSKAGSGT